jgi:large subunit ribosomal protein L5
MKTTRFEEMYNSSIKAQLQKELSIKNVMQIPKVSKIVLNIGVKDAVKDSKMLQGVKDVLTLIAGQNAVKTIAHKSIAGFKLREGVAIGVKVTLRKHKMYDFLDKLINIALPGVRDFQGVNAGFDGSGNFNLGITDWLVFPEVDYDKVDQSRGLNITICTTAETDREAYALMKAFNMPFKEGRAGRLKG